MDLVIFLAVVVDLVLSWIWLFSSRNLPVFDTLWVTTCLAAHVALYLLYVVPPKNHGVLRKFADVVLWCAMVSAPALSSNPLIGLAIITMAVVGLLYARCRKCILTRAVWSSATELMYVPTLLMQLARFRSIE